MNLTLDAVLTASGAVASAAFITGLIEVLKKVFPVVGNRELEPRLAFFFSAVLVLAAYMTRPGTIYNADTAFAALLAWYGIARISMSIHDDMTPPSADGETSEHE